MSNVSFCLENRFTWTSISRQPRSVGQIMREQSNRFCSDDSHKILARMSGKGALHVAGRDEGVYFVLSATNLPFDITT